VARATGPAGVVVAARMQVIGQIRRHPERFMKFPGAHDCGEAPVLCDRSNHRVTFPLLSDFINFASKQLN
jgi:hypothetical protein